MSVTIEMPDEIQRALKLPETEVRPRILLELSCVLYQRGLLPFGRAAELAAMGQDRFSLALSEREIPRHYGVADVNEDIGYANGE
jgi:predicted HTH domain antitoxin